MSRTYSDGTPAASYTYDTLTYGKGKLTKVSNANSTTEYTGFDILGRVTGHKQTTDGTAYATGYSYYLDGSLNNETYPSGRVVHNDLNADGQLFAVTSKKTVSGQFVNYADNASYNAAGAVTGLQLGNGLWESTSFNSRLQATNINLGTTAGTTDKLNLAYDYGSTQNNGNVMSQTTTVPGMSYALVQNYTYDQLNRLTSAIETSNGALTWKQAYTFDRYGNRNFDSANTNQPTPLDSKSNPTISASNNRITSTGYSYDNAGNTLTDANSQTYTYDAENKQTLVTNSSGTLGQYWYDGDGKRIKKYVPSSGETTVFVYDASGKTVAEYSTNVIPAANAQVIYTTADNLGTPRANTDKSGAVIARHDYMPFGEEIIALGGRATSNGYQADTIRHQFTGYQRDGEISLDFAEARYYSNQLGRFTSVDPLMASASPGNPQTLNRYAYVGNNPLTMTDPTGMFGDYYSYSGEYLGTDNHPKDGKVYFATETRRTDNSTYIDANSRQRTTLADVEEARINAVPLSPGTDNEAVRTLTGSIADNSIAGGKGIGEGLVNAGIDTLNSATQIGGPAGAAAGIPNPLAIPNIPASNSLEQSYNDATKVGIAAGTIFAGGVVGGGESSLSINPENLPPARQIYSARVLNRSAEESGPYHNFPMSFDSEIVSNGTRTANPNFVMYRQPGTVNGTSGVFEIGARPSASGLTEVITHRFFRP